MNATDIQDNSASEAEILLAHYEKIIEISKQLNSTLDHVDLLKQIVEASMELTDTEAASILLLDAVTGELRFEISSNMNPHEMDEIIVPLEGSIAGWVLIHGEPRVILDVADEPEHFGAVDDTLDNVTRNMVAVPMRTHTKVVGVLEVINKKNNLTFNDIDINILTTLAGHAAIAIENSRLFRQSDFIAEMVHELRTPLMSLKASTSLLLRPDLPENKREDMILTMQGETNRLMRLTTDFLDLARMESGRTRLIIKPFELPKLLMECADVVAPQAKEKGITIFADDTFYIVNGDREKLKQVLLNLLTNAVKYNRENGTIRIYSDPHNTGDIPMVEVAVEDTGHGLSKQDQSKMFQKFFRAEGTANKTVGTGLGLVITKHIVEAHNGHIRMESEEGVGTTFFFTVPVQVHVIPGDTTDPATL